MVNEHENNLFQIGELSEKAEVSKRTIRYYEELGILSPTRITSGGFRLYSTHDLQRLKIIQQFKKLDFTLDQIKEILQPGPKQGKEEQIRYSQQVIKTQLDATQQKIDELQKIKKRNQKALNMLKQCQECNREICPMDCSNLKAYI